MPLSCLTSSAHARTQALDLGQTLMNAQVLHHVTHSEAFKDGYFFYRFQEDIKTKVLNMRKARRWVVRLCASQERGSEGGGDGSGQLSGPHWLVRLLAGGTPFPLPPFSISHPDHRNNARSPPNAQIWVLPVNSPIEVVQTLTTCIFDALRKFLTPDGMRLDYAALGASRA